MQVHNLTFSSFFNKGSRLYMLFFILFDNYIMEIFSYQYIENFRILSYICEVLHCVVVLHFIYVVPYCSFHLDLARMKIAPHSSIVALLITA